MADKQLLSHDEVRAIADLARLALSDDEITLYAAQLSAILGDFQALQSVDTSQISLTASVLPLTSVMREDVPTAALTPAQVIANAPQADENQFLVGAVLGDE